MSFDRRFLDRCLWFFDYDGTLCPHQEVWEERRYDPQQIYQLATELKKKSSDLLWNTGRRTESLFSVEKQFQDISGYFIQGSQFWNAKSKQLEQLSPPVDPHIVSLWTNEIAQYKHMRFEAKISSCRIATTNPDHSHQIANVVQSISPPPQNWQWHLGGRGAELLCNGFNKASVIDHYLSTHSKKDSIVIAAGDDFFDKPAIEKALQLGGYAILVGPHCGWITEIPHHPSHVLYFDTPSDLHNFLRNLMA